MDDALDELFTLPVGDFVAARDALAGRLRAEGDKDGAKIVKALRRPSVAAWAVNQVARRHRELVEAIIAAGADVKRAQSRLSTGRAAGELREATARRRDAVQAATRAAVALAGAAHRDPIAATFEAAAGAEGEAVRAGRLTHELAPTSSFEVGPFGSATEPVDEPIDAAAEQRAAVIDTARRRAEEAATEREQAERALAEARRRHAASAAALEAAEDRAAAAEHLEQAARRAVDEAVTGR